MRFTLGLILGLFAGNAWAWLQGANPWPAWGVLAALMAATAFGFFLQAIMASASRADDDAVHIRPQPSSRPAVR